MKETMANLKIRAQEAARNAASFIEAENKKKAEMYEKELQKTLDDLSEIILEKSSNGHFKVEVKVAINVKEEELDASFDGIVVFSRDVLGDAVSILKINGYRAHIQNYDRSQTIKIFWDDPDDDSTK